MYAAARHALLGGALLLLGGGCPGGSPVSSPCARIPQCDAPCCNQDRDCEETICDGVLWVCRAGAGGAWAWQKNGASCPAGGDGDRDLGPRLDTLSACGANATLSSGRCVCKKGYVNQDGSWQNGCELIDPKCTVVSCGSCPDGYCGTNAHCRDNVKCRCVSRFWRNDDNDWSNGCETYTTTCSPTNCNDCYTGFCGPNADCMQNACACTVSGWTNCDAVWEFSGCECGKTCVSGKCQ